MEGSMAVQHDATPVVEMKGITKHFPGVTANNQVNLELYPGEVLALLGENGAGKSSLMNVLVGLYRQDEGDILVRGKPVEIHSPKDSMQLGIGMVHQNFKLVETMTVAENVVLGLKDLELVPSFPEICRKIISISRQYNLQVDPKAYIWQLGVGEQQRVEILKLIYRGADILILDEPTAVLTPQESGELSRIIAQMIDEGKSAIFITHKMEEVKRFSHRVQVLRKGETAAVLETSKTTASELARLMVGREVLFRLEKKTCCPGEMVLEVKDLCASNEEGRPALQDVSISIRAGEILGIAGVAGNGQRKLTEVITGLDRADSGKVIIKGKDMTNQTPLDLIQAGVSHIPPDRISMGIVGDMSVASNLVMKEYRSEPVVKRGVFNHKEVARSAKEKIDTYTIATPSQKTEAKFLSGGNIQKTILAREIGACRGLLIASYPSRGLDVGAMEAVRLQLINQRSIGNAVLLVSEDLEELITVADRIAVMYEGRIMGEVPAGEADIRIIGHMMAGASLEDAAQAAAETELGEDGI